MSEIKPVAWCLMTDDGQIINGVHEEARLAEQYRHRRAVDTLTSLYTEDQLAEAVAAERERCAKVCKDVRLNEISAPADWHNDACEDCIRAIRSAAK